jgi:crotonobetainyl-CoA:carnitine CoA-transferase CaiB-like acyl-CoA transferase
MRVTDDSRLPLDGVRVIDFSTHAVGPFATQIMAGLGATVIKVERGRGDAERFTEWPMFLACNRGKHSVVLDLSTEADRRVADDLVAGAKVLVEGYRPGVADRLGLGFERVRTLAPELVYVSLPGWGSGGPYASRRGYDIQFRAIAGDAYLNRESNGKPRPHTGGAPVFDYATAMYAVVGVLAALRNGPDSAVHLEVPILAAGLAWDFPRLIDSSRTSGHPQFEYAFQAADGRWICVNAPTDDQFAELCQGIGEPAFAQRADMQGFQRRRENAPEINALLADRIAARPSAHWLEEFGRRDIPCTPILAGHEVFDDPQVRYLDVVHGGERPYADLPIYGLPQRLLIDPPPVDGAGKAVREGGWEALPTLTAEMKVMLATGTGQRHGRTEG